MLNFLYDDVEQLAVSHDLLWVLYANAKTFRIVWTMAKMLLRFCSWTMMFREALNYHFPFSKAYYWTFGYNLTPLALSGRYT